MESISERDLLIALSYRYNGEWENIYNAIIKNEKASIEDVNLAKQSINSQILTILDEEYPNNLMRATCPPFVLYYYGDISLLSRFDNSLGVIGNREFSEYGELMTRSLVKGVSNKLVVVSGLAKGVDSIAADECLKQGGKTIAVLGTGIDICYPESSKELYETIKRKGLVLSEYPHKTIGHNTDSFPKRNRIIAALSRNLLITEAKKHSGTSITVNFLHDAANLLCVPERANMDSLCNILIKEGAKLITCPADILDEYNLLDKNAEFEI